MLLTYRCLEACKRGDRDAQEMLYTAYKSKVMGIARRYSGNNDEAKDIFQEAFIRIFNKLHLVNEPIYLNRWIIKVSIHTAINYYHKNIKYKGMIELEHVQFDSEDDRTIDKLSNEQLILLINSLPDGYRIVFNMYVIEGFKHSEIAEFLNISINTSKSQLSRAKQLLKQKLSSLGIVKYERYG